MAKSSSATPSPCKGRRGAEVADGRMVAGGVLMKMTESPKTKKYRSMKEIMMVTERVDVPDDGAAAEVATQEGGGHDEVEDDENYYENVVCEQCGSGERPEEMLLCDKCDKGFHMLCLRPIAVRVPMGPWHCPRCSDDDLNRPLQRFTQKKILDFFGIQKCSREIDNRSTSQEMRRRRRRARRLGRQKRRRRFLPYVPSESSARRLSQMASLATALSDLNVEFSDELTYMPGMAPRSANKAKLENGGMQVLSKEDAETVEHCRAMYKLGYCPPLRVVFDTCEGYTVEADGPIKDLTFIAEYIGDVDYIKNREHDDSDCMMTLLLAREPSKSLVICPDKRGNIARFINGINNHTPEGKKKQNIKCVRYDVNGQCRVFLVATRDIAKGERLYYDYNGYENEYPTHYFL